LIKTRAQKQNRTAELYSIWAYVCIPEFYHWSGKNSGR